jgi:photosystem II stability/assembly factor-like uncharacterized protein
VFLTVFHADGELDVIAGSQDDGAFRTLDGGVTWTPAESGLPRYGSTSGSRVQPLNALVEHGDALFVATGGGPHFVAGDPHCGCSTVDSGDGVYRTTDRGASWQRVSTGLPINFFYFGEPILRPILDLLDVGDALLATTEQHGVYRTTNLGATWSPVSGAPGGVAFATLGAAHYLLGEEARMFRSTDDGLTWQEIETDLPAEAFGTLMEHAGALYASAAGYFPGGPGVHRSTDGVTWSRLDAGLEETPVVALTVADGRLFAGTVDRGVWVLASFDLDGDGVVGVSDLLVLLGAWGDCPPPPAACPADFDGDGAVGVADLLQLLANWS